MQLSKRLLVHTRSRLKLFPCKRVNVQQEKRLAHAFSRGRGCFGGSDLGEQRARGRCTDKVYCAGRAIDQKAHRHGHNSGSQKKVYLPSYTGAQWPGQPIGFFDWPQCADDVVFTVTPILEISQWGQGVPTNQTTS